MYLRRSKYKEKTYYYLARRIPGTSSEERLAVLGSIDAPSPNQESQLIFSWIIGLMSGSEFSKQKCLETGKRITASRHNEEGKNFDLEKCFQEMEAIYQKYGSISKSILERKARPNRELSWGVQTVMRNLKIRKMTLKSFFEAVRNSDLEKVLNHL